MLKSLMLLFERAGAARKSKGSNRRDRACFKRRLQRNFAHRSGTHGCSAASEKFANRKATKEGAIWKLCALSQLPRWLRLTPFSTEDASALGFVPGVLGTGKIDCFFNRSDASTRLVFVSAPKKPDALRRSASVALVASLCLGGCASGGAPTYSIVGAFFPGWMFCAVLGIVGAIAARGLFVATGLNRALPFQLFVCSSLGVIVAVLAWIYWFGQ